jgi:hypothetical protein
MAALDRKAFIDTLKVVALELPKAACHQVLTLLRNRGYSLQRRHIKPIQSPRDATLAQTTRLLLLKEDIKGRYSTVLCYRYVFVLCVHI